MFHNKKQYFCGKRFVNKCTFLDTLQLERRGCNKNEAGRKDHDL